MDNTLKASFILLAIAALIILIFGKISIILASVLVASVLAFLYLAPDKIILKKYRAEEVKNKYIKSVVEELSKKVGIKEPRVYILNLNIATSLAVGKNRNSASIGITRNLLKKLNKAELKAVLAHEITYIKSNSILLGCIVAMIAGLIVSIAYFLKFLFDVVATKKSKIGLVFFSIIMPVAALLLHIVLSRKDKLKADLKASKLVEQPYTLISALKKLEKEKMSGLEWSSHLFIVSHLTRYSGILFSTHPFLKDRIRRLRKIWKVIIERKTKIAIGLPFW